MSQNKYKRVALALITNHQDDILMGVRNDSKKWTCPGGSIEPGEDPVEGLAREIKEETNLDVEDIKLVEAKWNKEKKTLLYLFKVTVDPKGMVTSKKDPDNEVESWHYVDPNDVKDNLHVPLQDNIIIQYWAKN